MTVYDLQSALPDRYRVKHEIGRGGMATVYLAEDLQENRDVAVKVLSGELGSSLDATRFVREIKIAGELIHPNILPAYDSGSGNGLVYYVMPFISGKSVRARLDEERQFSIDEAVRITCEVADALAYAHERGIVHRDIKPENILLQDGHAIVADFGIARIVAEQGATLTQTGLSLGTAQYMSPEQASAEKVDGRSDIYSLGCVLYEMIVGEPPFTGPNAMAVLARSVTQPVPSIRVVRSSVPEHVEFAIMRALEKVPVDRFQTVAEFRKALLDGDDSAAGTRQRKAYTAAYRTGAQELPIWRRPRTMPFLAAMVAMVLLGSGWIVMHNRKLAPNAVSADAKHIAVMYFDVANKDSSLRFIADGLTESLIDELDRVPALDVVSRNAVRPFRGRAFVSDSVHHTLNVGTIVRGEVGSGPHGADVTVRLVDAVDGNEIKHATFDFDTTNVIAARQQAAERVADFLRSEVGLQVRLKESRQQAGTPQAWLAEQRAEKAIKDADSLLVARVPDQAMVILKAADSTLVRAIALDKSWAQPWISRAVIARRIARAQRDQPALANAALDSGRVFADHALALDPRSADAHEIAGRLAFGAIELRTIPQGPEWDAALARADSELHVAVTINNQQASAFEGMVNVAYAEKRVPEALAAARDAYKADAYLANASAILQNLFWGNYDLENFPEARQWCDIGHKRFPSSIPFVQCSMYLMMAKGSTADPDEAWKMAATIRALAKPTVAAYEDHFARTLVGGVLGKAGLKDSANKVLVAARADRTIDPGQEIIGREIMMRLMYGDFDTAIARLGDYLLIHPDHRKGLANQTAWYYRDVQSDPRFKRLIAGAH